MQTIRFDKPKDKDVIDIDDVVEGSGNIYCYANNSNQLRFLFRYKGIYHWTTLSLSNEGIMYCNGYTSLSLALQAVSLEKVLIFSSQCEVLEYAKNM